MARVCLVWRCLTGPCLTRLCLTGLCLIRLRWTGLGLTRLVSVRLCLTRLSLTGLRLTRPCLIRPCLIRLASAGLVPARLGPTCRARADPQPHWADSNAHGFNFKGRRHTSRPRAAMRELRLVFRWCSAGVRGAAGGAWAWLYPSFGLPPMVICGKPGWDVTQLRGTALFPAETTRWPTAASARPGTNPCSRYRWR
jgi:hypothetical protein